MSPITALSLASSLFGSVTGSKSAEPASGESFQALLAQRMGGSGNIALNALFGQSGGVSQALGAGQGVLSGLSPSGRNMSLFDPESGYRMMSTINQKDVDYQAQYAELSAMGVGVTQMQQAGQALGNFDPKADAVTLKGKLTDFAASYNEWIKRFDPTVQNGGVLDGTQAAEISMYELEQSVENVFHGARQGMHGLRDLGFTIDQTTNLAHFDPAKFDAALNNNRQGVVDTLNDFSRQFTTAANLLNQSDNFIPRRLNNLDRAIDFISANKTSLQSEFGTGEAAKLSPQVSAALAAYQKLYKS